MSIKKILGTIILLSFTLQSICVDTIVVEWNKALSEAADNANYNVPVWTRLSAILNSAIYDAWASYDGKAVPAYVSDFTRMPEVQRTEESKHAAINYAAWYALKELLPSQKSIFDKVMQKYGHDITNLPMGTDTPAGVGVAAAKAVLKARQDDGSNQRGNYAEPRASSKYTPYKYVNTVDKLNDINKWQPLKNPDGTAQKFYVPHWAYVTPFALTSGSQFRPKGPKTAKNEKEFIAEGQQIVDIGKKLTKKQKLIARYWAGKVKGTRPWEGVAQYISNRDKHTLDDDVKMYFAISNGMFDADIAAWDSKRLYNSVRPITLIKNRIDPKWEPYVETPPWPEYISQHSAINAALAEVLKRYLGNDRYGGSFSDRASGVTLRWPTLTNFADEAGMSRLYGGVHFRDGDLDGRQVGRKVGKVVWDKVSKLINGGM